MPLRHFLILSSQLRLPQVVCFLVVFNNVHTFLISPVCTMSLPHIFLHLINAKYQVNNRPINCEAPRYVGPTFPSILLCPPPYVTPQFTIYVEEN
jgi:hypothetical protein